MTNEIKIAVGIPTYGTIKTKTFESIVKFVKSVPYNVPVISQQGPYIQENRNTIVERAKILGFERILFIDHDMVFEPEGVQQLLSRDRDIVGAPFAVKFLPTDPFCAVKKTDSTGAKIWEEIEEGLFKCCGLGTAFILIKTSVFDKVPKPWFEIRYNNDGLQEWGEDLWFCKQARDAGFDIYCDTKVYVGHVGDFTFELPKDFKY